MKTRIITAVIFTAIILAFVIPAFSLPFLPIILFTLIAMGASLELHQAILHKISGINFKTMLLGALLMLVPLIVWYVYRDLRPDWHFLRATDLPLDENWKTDMVWLLALGISLSAVVTLGYVFTVVLANCLGRGPAAISKGVAEVTAAVYLGMPFSVLVLYLYAVPHGYYWLLLALFLPWITDVFAYFSGVIWGKRKILPRISPKKTLEGFLGGMVGSMLVSSLVFITVMHGAEPLRDSRLDNFIFGLITGLVISLVAQLGDWLASSIKRWVRIKDFSHLLPGHGGLLDRFDSVILTLPVSLVCAIIYYLF